MLAGRGRISLARGARLVAAPRRLSTRASEDFWPDGTPKKFRGREAWKNWIDWESPHRQQTDELNRARHYFWHVDHRGRLWRKELDQPDRTFGQMRDTRILDYFFGHMQRNTTGLYGGYPFISFRMHEHYYTSCSDSPVVFNDLREGELRYICPEGELAKSVTTPFDPSRLRIDDDGRLFHPVTTKAVDTPNGELRPEELMALIEATTAQQLFEHCEVQEVGCGRTVFVLQWDGREHALTPLVNGAGDLPDSR